MQVVSASGKSKRVESERYSKKTKSNDQEEEKDDVQEVMKYSLPQADRI